VFVGVTILDRIFETKRHEVDAAKRRVSESELRDLAHASPVTPFASRLQASSHPVSLIAEVKKASPSQGLIRSDFDAVQIACAYERAGADCLSVLTDHDYFQGCSEYLTAVKDHVSLPCLRKDFVFDPYQVLESRALGADAVLLIAAYLDLAQLSDLKAEIEALGMDALVEVHNEAECESAIALGCNLVGVNNRNLKDFETKLANSAKLTPLLKFGLPQAVVVSESAIETHADVETIRNAGARSVLIGTTFCLAPDIESKVREVMGW
jgi:indole-3-glycerol phosphate synthase